MTIDDAIIVGAGAAVWSATIAIVGVLWGRMRTLEKTVAKLQAEKAEGDAAKVMIESCPNPACPFAVAVVLCLCLTSCASKTPPIYDQRILVVVRTEQPSSSMVGQGLQWLLKLVIP